MDRLSKEDVQREESESFGGVGDSTFIPKSGNRESDG